MQAVLIRIGVDHSYGGWNAPADPDTGQFVYVPIPEKAGTAFHPQCDRPYRLLEPALQRFAEDAQADLFADLGCPDELLDLSMHLDPDFECLTYGDDGGRRGSHIRQLKDGDLLVFYAGFRPIRQCEHKLIYALVGLFVVDEVVEASTVPEARWAENAHTRKIKRGRTDIVVRAKPGVSGRFSRFIPIGEYRDRAYRVRTDLLKAWGGLTVNDGYIQRSARPPRFKDATRFRKWLDKQQVPLVAMNNPSLEADPVVIVHLRQPRGGNPEEMRSDPFWEFGSFGCTGCHRHNQMHPARIEELEGARLAFAQGGKQGFRLVMLTPPVRAVHHAKGCELRWEPAEMPFRYDQAPLLIGAGGESDCSSLKDMIATADRGTWPARFSSCFRSRRQALPAPAATELVRRYEQLRAAAPASSIATRYDQAMPYAPNVIDKDRRHTYEQKLRGLENSIHHCGSTRPKI